MTTFRVTVTAEYVTTVEVVVPDDAAAQDSLAREWAIHAVSEVLPVDVLTTDDGRKIYLHYVDTAGDVEVLG